MRETRVRSLGWEHAVEKEMAAHSSILAWEIPWTEEPGRLQSMGSQRVGHDWRDLAAAAAERTMSWLWAWQSYVQFNNNLNNIKTLWLFNLYVEYIVRNAGLDEAQAGIKIARRNINNLRYADDTTLMAKSEEELKSLLMKVKEWKSWLKT